MMVEKWATGRTVDELKECRRSLLRGVGLGLSYGIVFILLSVLVPGISMERQIMCWQTAMIAFGGAVHLAWMHLTLHKPELPPV